MGKILDIIESIAHEKNITREHAIEAFKDALINTAKRLTSQTSTFNIIIDNDTKTYSVNKIITVVEDDSDKLYIIDKRGEKIKSDSYIALSVAKEEFDQTIEIGDQLTEEFILEDYGRTASSNLFKELLYLSNRSCSMRLWI